MIGCKSIGTMCSIGPETALFLCQFHQDLELNTNDEDLNSTIKGQKGGKLC